MSDEKYISSKQAAEITGYASDYVGQLCRLGKVKSRRIGRDWMISEKSILNYKNGNQIFSIRKSRLDDWDKALFKDNHPKYNFDLGYLIRPLIFTAVFMVIITGLILNLGAISKLEISLPKIETAKFFSLASLPSLPFTWEDSKLAVLDLKNRFLENLFLWKDYLASWGGDIKIIAQDFLSIKPEVVETLPPDLPQEGSKIITFGATLSEEKELTHPQTPSLTVREGERGGGLSSILSRLSNLENKILGIRDVSTLDQKLSALNDSILIQIRNSLALIEKRLPSNQVQNPVVFLTTQVPGPQQAGGGSPPQTGSGISASFGDFSSGISTGGNLTASGNIILGQDTKTVGITSNTWKITSAGAASGFTSLSSTSLNTGPITASSLSVSSITSTGNVGVGTTSPGALLSVAGRGLFSFLTSEGFITTSYLTATSSATSTIPKLLVNNIPTLAHIFSTWATGVASSSYPDASLVINPSSATADSNLFSLAVGSSVKALIDAEGDLFIRNLVAEGSVTQGATTLASLSVEGNSTFGDAIGDTVTYNAGTLTFNNRATTTIPNLTVNAFSIATSTSIVPTFTISTASSPFGLVGIGTTSPTESLSTAGRLYIGGTGTSTFENNLIVRGTLQTGSGSIFLGSNFLNFNTSASTSLPTALNAWNIGNSLLSFDTSNSRLGVGTSTPGSAFSVAGNSLLGGALVAYSSTFGPITATSTLAISGAITSTASGANTFPYASSTALTVSGTGFFGTASTTNLTVSSLTSGRVPYITTAGAFADSSGLTWNNSLSRLTATYASTTAISGTNIDFGTLTLTNALGIASGGTGAATLTGLLQGNGTSAITAVTGTAGQFPYFNGTNTLLATSTIFLATSGNVGIGTTTPNYNLVVNGSTNNFFQIASSTNQGILVVDSNGNVGIGDASPAALLTVGSGDLFQVISTGEVRGIAGAVGTPSYSFTGDTNSGIYSGGADILRFATAGADRVTIDASGNFSIGTTDLGGAGGNAIAIKNANAPAPSAVAAQGFLYVSAGALKYQGPSTLTTVAAADYAEDMSISGKVEAAEIVSVSLDRENLKPNIYNHFKVERSKKPYDEKVIGISSSFQDENQSSTTQPISLVGRVPVKVNLEGGAIGIGDRITSSSIAGVGMKATTSGQTVGIALEPYDGTQNFGTSTPKILVFVNLGYSKLDSEITSNSNGWIVDQATGKIKTSYTLDMDGKDIVNVRNILSASGLWSIDENGKLIVQEIQTKKLTVTGTQGITIYDKKGQAGCLSIDDVTTGAIAVVSGVCGTQTTIVGSDPTLPTITILGNNPAVISVGATYADPGVTVTDNIDQNLGYSASLNGGPALSQGAGLTIDTSTTTTHIILYSATDQAGNTATATRTVQVQ